MMAASDGDIASKGGLVSIFDKLPDNYERKMAIVHAIAVLSADMPLSGIRIDAICREAGVSRTTFYRLFDNKYEAVSWYHGLLQHGSAQQVGKTLTFHEASVIMNQRIYEDRDLYRRLYARFDQELFSLGARLNAEIYRAAVNTVPGGHVDEMLEAEIVYWSESVFRIIQKWAGADFAYTPEMVTAIMDDVRPRLLGQTLDGQVLSQRAGAGKSCVA